MKRYSILLESRSGIRRDTGFILSAADKAAALAAAERLGIRGRVLALEIVDAQEVA